MLDDVAPGYTSLFKGCHLSKDLLKHHGRSVDLSLISGLQRYCLVLPEDVVPCQVRTWPWSDDQVAQWVEHHKIATGKKPEVVRPVATKRVRRPVEPSFVIPALVGSTGSVSDMNPSRDESVVVGGERKLKRLRPLAEACPPHRESPASSSTDGAPGSLASKWSEPP